MRVTYKCDKRKKPSRNVQPVVLIGNQDEGVEFRGPWTSAREARMLVLHLLKDVHDIEEVWGHTAFAECEPMSIITID